MPVLFFAYFELFDDFIILPMTFRKCNNIVCVLYKPNALFEDRLIGVVIVWTDHSPGNYDAIPGRLVIIKIVQITVCDTTVNIIISD